MQQNQSPFHNEILQAEDHIRRLESLRQHAVIWPWSPLRAELENVTVTKLDHLKFIRVISVMFILIIISTAGFTVLTKWVFLLPLLISVLVWLPTALWVETMYVNRPAIDREIREIRYRISTLEHK